MVQSLISLVCDRFRVRLPSKAWEKKRGGRYGLTVHAKADDDMHGAKEWECKETS